MRAFSSFISPLWHSMKEFIKPKFKAQKDIVYIIKLLQANATVHMPVYKIKHKT